MEGGVPPQSGSHAEPPPATLPLHSAGAGCPSGHWADRPRYPTGTFFLPEMAGTPPLLEPVGVGVAGNPGLGASSALHQGLCSLCSPKGPRLQGLLPTVAAGNAEP